VQSQTQNMHNLFVITHVGMIASVLDINVQPEQMETLRKLLLEDYKPQRLPTPQAPGANEMAYADSFFEAMREGRHIAPPSEGMFPFSMVLMTPTTMTILEENHDDEDEDLAFLRAQEASLQEAAAPEPPTRRLRRVPPEMESVLRPAEKAEEGDAICLACAENRASICLGCNHQCLCDVCMKKLLQLPGVNRICPVCRKEIVEISRPILSGK
jgi:hypothetical protein